MVRRIFLMTLVVFLLHHEPLGSARRRSGVFGQWPLQPGELSAQLKSGVRSLSAPVDNLLSNWAYMVMGSLAWNRAWAALLLPEAGRWSDKTPRGKMQAAADGLCHFPFRPSNIPAQIARTGRKILYRLLAWNPWQHVFFRLLGPARSAIEMLTKPP